MKKAQGGRRFYTGGVLDTRVPNLAEILTPGLGIDPDAFAAWLSPIIGLHRMWSVAVDDHPSRTETMACLDSLVAAMRAAREAIEFGAIPPVAEGMMCDALFRWRSAHLHELAERARHDLLTIETIARDARGKCQAEMPKSGRRNAHLADSLFVKVADHLEELGIKKRSVARDLAVKILAECGVPISDPRRAARRARR